MTALRTIQDKQLMEKGIRVLFKELGYTDAIRFLAMPREKREESVQRHKKWQRSLNKDQFFNEVFDGD